MKRLIASSFVCAAVILSACGSVKQYQELSPQDVLERASYVHQLLSSAAYAVEMRGRFPTRAGVASGSIVGTGIVLDGGSVHRLHIVMTGSLVRASSSPQYDVRLDISMTPLLTAFRINRFDLGIDESSSVTPYLHQWWHSEESMAGSALQSFITPHPSLFQANIASLRLESMRFEKKGVGGRPCYVILTAPRTIAGASVRGEFWIDSEEFVLLHARHTLMSNGMIDALPLQLTMDIDVGRINDPRLTVALPPAPKVINPSHALLRFLPTTDLLR